MKVERKESFTPVVITLETQEEVNKIFALFNYNPLSNAIEMDDCWSKFDKYSTEDYNKWHNKIDELVERKK